MYCIMGTSKDISLGPTALLSLITSHSFTALPEPDKNFTNDCFDVQDFDVCCKDGDDFLCTPLDKAIAACMLAGLLQLLMGVVNFGIIIDFIGFPVINGFTTAAAVTIFTSQVCVLGSKPPTRTLPWCEELWGPRGLHVPCVVPHAKCY